MNLDSVMNRAFDFVDRSLRQKQENFKTKLRSDETMQKLKSKQDLEMQKLANFGAANVQQIRNRGALAQTGLDNIGKYDAKRIETQGKLAVEGNKLDLEKRKFLYNAGKDTRIFNEGVRQFDVTRGDNMVGKLMDSQKDTLGVGAGVGGAGGGLPDETIVDRIKNIDRRMNVGAHIGSNGLSQEHYLSTQANQILASMKTMTPEERQKVDIPTSVMPYVQRAMSGNTQPSSTAVSDSPVTNNSQSMTTPRDQLGMPGNPGTGFLEANGRRFEIRNNVEREVFKGQEASKKTNSSSAQNPTNASWDNKNDVKDPPHVNTGRATIKGTPVGEDKKPEPGKTTFNKEELERFKRPERDYKPADNPIEALSGKRFSANPESLLTKVQKWAGRTQTPDSRHFGEDLVAATLRQQGLSDNLQTLKNMSERLQKKYPNISPEKLAEMIKKSKLKQETR